MLSFGGGAHYCLGASLLGTSSPEGLRVMTRRMLARAAPAQPLEATDRTDGSPATVPHRIRPRALNIGHRPTAVRS